mmetsp:Transcript_15898/g.36375  ORF Transcript_15898/g.36375 Transcript_15898/m.36375 type:complete len:234 (+) Transcript_15898:32-733(+)
MHVRERGRERDCGGAKHELRGLRRTRNGVLHQLRGYRRRFHRLRIHLHILIPQLKHPRTLGPRRLGVIHGYPRIIRQIRDQIGVVIVHLHPDGGVSLSSQVNPHVARQHQRPPAGGPRPEVVDLGGWVVGEGLDKGKGPCATAFGVHIILEPLCPDVLQSLKIIICQARSHVISGNGSYIVQAASRAIFVDAKVVSRAQLQECVPAKSLQSSVGCKRLAFVVAPRENLHEILG